jgi:hypothetical protein
MVSGAGKQRDVAAGTRAARNAANPDTSRAAFAPQAPLRGDACKDQFQKITTDSESDIDHG